MSPSNRTQLESEMRRKLLEAQQAYQSAAAKTKKLLQNYGKSPSGLDSHPDLEQAMAAEAHALEDYRLLLKQFTDLILRGKSSE
jgi:hypothetical protein